MEPGKGERLAQLHTQLLRAAQAWAGKKPYDRGRISEIRKEAILILHDHYRENIPAYKKLAEEEGIGELDDIEPIKQNLMSTDDVFKSYNQQWLDDNDFEKMNQWLSTVFHQKIELDVGGVSTIDQWIDRLTESGVTPAYSSGTTGRESGPCSKGPWYGRP